MTDVCAGTYSDLEETLLSAIDLVNQNIRSATIAISRDTDSIAQSAQRLAHAGPDQFAMEKAIAAKRILEHDTLVRAVTYDGDFLKFIGHVADETAIAVLTPQQPHFVRAVLAVAWEKLIEEPVDAATLFVIAVIKEMRKQLPNASAADSYLLQLDEYMKSGQKAILLMEELRQLLLAGMSGPSDGALDLQSLETLAATAIRVRSEDTARQFQSPG